MSVVLLNVVLDDSIVSLVWIAAAVLTTSSFLPQIVKAYRTKRMDDVSAYLMILFSIGTTLWMIYGHKSDSVIILANAAATTFNFVLL